MTLLCLLLASVGAEPRVTAPLSEATAEDPVEAPPPHPDELIKVKSLNLPFPSFKFDPRLLHRYDLPRLRRLWLSDCDVNDEQLLRLPTMPKLRHLGLEATDVSGRGLRFLLRKKGQAAPRLEYLELIGDFVDDDGLAVISEFTNLRKLHVGGPRVTDEGVKHLAKLKNLEVLYLTGPEVSDEAWRELLALSPGISIYNHSRARGSYCPLGRPWGEPRTSDDPFAE